MSRLIGLIAASTRAATPCAAVLALGSLTFVVALLTTASGTARAEGMLRVEVQIWQHATNPGDIRVGARPADSSWPALEMIPLTLDDGVSSSGRYRYGETAIAVEWRSGAAPLEVEVRVWQHVERERDLRVSARGSLGSWSALGTVPLALDDATGSSGYRAGSVMIEAPLPNGEPGEPLRYRSDTEPKDNEARVPEAASLIVVKDAASYDSLLLEWTGGPADATKWQYRQRRWEHREPLAWGVWTDIPHSGADTRSYRRTDLCAGTGYDFEVRAVVGAVAGEPSSNGITWDIAGYPGAITHGRDVPLRLSTHEIVEGDGCTRWSLGSVSFVIPDGMRVVADLPYVTGGGHGGGVPLYVWPDGGGLTFSQGRVVSRYVAPPAAGAQDVDALLDQIVASVRSLAADSEPGAPPVATYRPPDATYRYEETRRGQTLQIVLDRGELRCGVSWTRPLFGFGALDGSVSGFDIEFCQAIAAAVLGDPAQVDYVDASDALSRFELLGSGAVDVLIRATSSVARHDRDQGVDFARPTFWTGMGFAVWSDSAYETTSDMAGATICVESGTIAEQYLAEHFTELGIVYTPLGGEWGSRWDVFFSGRCDALAAATVDIADRIAVRDDAARYRVLPQVISRDPLAPAVRDYDSEWKDIVNWVVHGLIAAEELGVTQANVVALAADPPDARVARLLGVPYEGGEVYDHGFGRVGAQFIQRAIAAVGNYGEIYDRTIGDAIPRACSLNALAVDGSADCPNGQGGLMYALPYR